MHNAKYRMLRFFKNNPATTAVAALVVLNAALALCLIGVSRAEQATDAQYAESLRELSQVTESFGDIGDFFLTLAQERGAVYAFEILKRAPLPPNIDTHLLGHLIGDELYRQQGIEGMKHCTSDFRYACSHTVVIGALLEHGLPVLGTFQDICAQSKGGDTAYPMCFHGAGHGVLAFAEYDLEDALALCEQLSASGRNSQEYVECAGGVTMEMVSGIHDPALWEKKKTEYLSADEPLSLCMNGWYPKEAQHMCLMYVTPELFAAAGLDMTNPDPAGLRRALAFCNRIPEANEADRYSCYAGIGKDLPVIQQENDVRRMNELRDADLETIYAWCQYAENEEGVRSCISGAFSSIFWGGENDPNVSARFCAIMESADREACFSGLIPAVATQISAEAVQEQFCAAMPEPYQDRCYNELQ